MIKDYDYCVLRVNIASHLVMLTARLRSLLVGEAAQHQDECVIPSKFGEQFQASEISTQMPSGITCGRRLVILIGQPKALSIGIQTVKAVTRLTRFKERLR